MTKKRKTGKLRPDIFSYTNVRDFLKDYMEFRKSNNKRFSYRSFAIQLNMKSHTHLPMVINGKQKLSRYMVGKLAKNMKLNELEKSHLHYLNDCGNSESIGRVQPKKLSLKDTYYILLIGSMSAHEDFQVDPRWISRRTDGFIPTKKAHKLLTYAMREGILVKKKEKWRNNFERLFLHESARKSKYAEEAKLFSDSLFAHAGLKKTTQALTFFISSRDAFMELIDESRSVVRKLDISDIDPSELEVFAINISGVQVTKR